jgi:hypothetical protein
VTRGSLAAAFFACLAGAALGRAAELAEFSCQRPEPAEAGALHNVSVAAHLVDGLRLEPGAVFSFNAAMRPGQGSFVEGTSYANGLVTSSDGGGICQVSSALYNLALLSGLEVAERQPHSIRDPAAAYVPAGLDAAVAASAQLDLSFLNSLAFPVTLRARAEGPRLKVWLEGKGALPERRWVEVKELERRPRGVLWEGERQGRRGEAYDVLRKGFDGLRVSRTLYIADASGNTRAQPLGVDRYLKVNERRVVRPSPKKKGHS